MASPDDPIQILIADDSDLFVTITREILVAEADMRVAGVAVDGRQAVDLAMQIQPDVILMDVNMPELNGIEATRLIRQKVPGAVVIGMSSDQDVGKDQILDAGAVAFLTKPGEIGRVAQIVRDNLG